jgi:hypothetical protein
MVSIEQFNVNNQQMLAGPTGASSRASATQISAILFERLHDPANWYGYLERFDVVDWDASAAVGGVDLTEAGAGTQTFLTAALGACTRFTTAAADNDAQLLHTTSAGRTTLQPWIQAQIRVGVGDLTNFEVSMGLSNTAPGTAVGEELSEIVDGSRWYLKVGAAATNWQCESSVVSVDTLYTTTELAQLSTFITLGLFLDSSRKPHFFLDGTEVFEGPALTDEQAAPHLQIQAAEAGAKALDVRYLAWGQRYEAE